MTSTHQSNPSGSIVCVGTGMTLGSHISPLSKNYIVSAEIVFAAVSDAVVEKWIEELSHEFRSMQIFYQEGLDRRISYQKMVDAMMTEVRKGKRVVGAFYGHPGVFAWAPHKVIEVARSEGFAAHMEPGISAADCLFADLGIDPGRFGIIHYEASQFMLYQKPVDQSAYLILWQIGLAGDLSMTKFSTSASFRQILVDKLSEFYSADHLVTLYECPTLPIYKFVGNVVKLGDLASAAVSQHTTLVIPPSMKSKNDEVTRVKLSNLRKALDKS